MSDAPSSSSAVIEEQPQGDHMMTIEIRHRTSTHRIRCPVTDSTVGFLRLLIEEVTDVPAASQKLVGLSKGRIPEDHVLLSALGVGNGHKIMLIGDPIKRVIAAPSELENLPEVVMDFDDMPVEGDILNRDEAERLIVEHAEKLDLHFINPIRPGKKLLVLDIDYTIFDCKSNAPIQVLKRPFTDEFLTTVYDYYDIAFWSQTKWTWIEAKLTEMELLHPAKRFRISWILDRSVMFPITVTKSSSSSSSSGSSSSGSGSSSGSSTSGGGDGTKTHEVKPLAIIWRKLGDVYGPHNTVHVDDLGRNFALNPANGIKIRAYKDAPTRYTVDRELRLLTKYLLFIASMPDLSAVDHKEWRHFAKHKL